MTSGTMTWEEFLKEATDFVELSNKFQDQWSVIVKDDEPGNTYLLINKKVQVTCGISDPDQEYDDDLIDSNIEPINGSAVEHTELDLINMEYHVVYSISYQVPILYFKGSKSDGTLVSLEDSWQIFTNHSYSRKEMLSILTQMDHPVLFRPFLSLHPCKTADILAQTKDSRNRIVTFLSVMGPYVKLNLKEEYGLAFKE